MLSRRLSRCLLVSSVLLCSPLSLAGAQLFRGLVVDDSTKLPLTGALLTLLDSRGGDIEGRNTRADSLGRFALHTPSTGQFAVRVTRIGYSPLTSDRVSVGTGEAAAMTFSMSAIASTLGRVVVVETRRLNGYELHGELGYDLRRTKPGGKFLDSAALQKYAGSHMHDVLLSHAGLGIVLDQNPSSRLSGTELRMQNGLEIRPPPIGIRPRMCSPEIWIDGAQHALNAQPRIRGLTADMVHGIEVYSPFRPPPGSIAGEMGMEQTLKPQQYRCGVIVVWTKIFIQSQRKAGTSGGGS